MQDNDRSPYYSQRPFPERPPAIPPSPNNPPWGVLGAVGVWIASVFFILIIPTLFLLPYLATLDPPIAEAEQIVEFAKNDPVSVFLQILAVIPAHVLTLVLAWLLVTQARKYSFRKMLGWQTGGIGMWLSYIPIMVGFFFVAYIVNIFIPEQDNDLLRVLRSSRSAIYIVAFVATFTAPLVEEVVYRGVLYSAFQRKIGVPAAFIVVTFLFALVHVPQYWPSFSTIFLLALLSVTLTAIRVKTNNLLPCVILHTLFNGLQSVILIMEPNLKTVEVQEQTAAFLRIFQ